MLHLDLSRGVRETLVVPWCMTRVRRMYPRHTIRTSRHRSAACRFRPLTTIARSGRGGWGHWRIHQ
jgi:hypothetical protein